MYINLPLFIYLSQLCFSWETSLLLYLVILHENLNLRALAEETMQTEVIKLHLGTAEK